MDKKTLGLHLDVSDADTIEHVLDLLSRVSRHALLVACVRRGLEEFASDPQLVQRYLPPDHRGRPRKATPSSA